MTKARRLIVFCLFCGLWLTPIAAFAEEEYQSVDGSSDQAVAAMTVDEVADSLDLGKIEEFLPKLEDHLAEYLPVGTLDDLWQQAKNGNFDWDFAAIGQIFINTLFKEIIAGGALLVQIVFLAAVSLILNNLQNNFGEGGVSSLSHGVVYLVLISIALQVFLLAGNAAKDTVELMSGFLYAVTPTLLTLMVAMGGVSAVGVFNPAMLGLVGVATNLINVVVVPLVYFCGAMVVASYISPKLNLSKMAKLLKDISLGFLTIILTLFTTALGVIGIAGSSIDGLAIKAAKSASGLFIPIVGRTIADVLDTVVGTALILKNSIGILGLIVLVIICVLPAIKIVVLALLFRLSAALVQPMGDQQLGDALQGLGSVVMMFFAVVAACGIFFFFIISITIGMGNLTMALR